jgi:hypothetical protein
MKKWLVMQSWHIAMLFVGISASAVLFAWATFNLYNAASDNFRFIKDYGWMGLAEGGLLQFLEICWNAFLSLLLFLLFKGCETEIIKRWRDLHKGNEKSDGTEQM